MRTLVEQTKIIRSGACKYVYGYCIYVARFLVYIGSVPNCLISHLFTFHVFDEIDLGNNKHLSAYSKYPRLNKSL